jgi:ATP-dependent protease HslVU (ClpYQ) ATPase subunit
MEGRFPIRIDLKMLRAKEFSQILRIQKYGLLEQYKTLLAQDNINLSMVVFIFNFVKKIFNFFNNLFLFFINPKISQNVG